MGDGYHLVGCRIGANAIRLHDEVVATVAKLFRTLRLDAIVEPTRLFNNVDEDASSQRPDIFIRNPRGLGRQVIIDVAVTGVNGQSRTTDEATDRPLQTRFDQKMAKYGRVVSRTICGLYRRFFLTLVKFMVRSKLLLKSKSHKSW